jgi:predicted pyridoxine 5'-phosphate oxidase superfamily flavin-nucleotide-binding protein
MPGTKFIVRTEVNVVVTGFHEGELAMQRRAGVTAEAARLAGMLAEPNLDGGGQRFLAARTFAVLTAADGAGRLWSSPLIGAAGFLDGHGQTLGIRSTPRAGDPLHGLAPGQPVGMLAIEFATRRRMRVNGTLVASVPGALTVAVDQAFGNCPQYIQQRLIVLAGPVPSGSVPSGPVPSGPVPSGSVPSGPMPPGPVAARPLGGDGQLDRPDQARLTPDQLRIIRGADTFFLGSAHPERGRDASHRGGPPGFVRADGSTLWWPDYPGNNMFNSLGNLAVDPAASLLFIDFGTGQTVHLSGTAAAEWAEPGTPGDDGWTGRRVRFTPEVVRQPAEALAMRATAVVPYPRNPRITG